jgi:ABC-type branched-subunit amino acid transport system substrate-binding protein
MRINRRVRLGLAAFLALSMTAAACGNDDDDDTSAPDPTETDAGDDGDDEGTGDGILEGIKGTLPAAEITSEFRDRLLEVDSGLVDFSYGPEAYDAIVIVALAAIAADTDEPAAVARQINGITRDGTECETFAECRELLEAGEDIDYNGPSGPQAFSQAGEPTEASFAILQYGSDNQIDDDLTEYRFASIDDPEFGDADPSCTGDSDGVLTIGTLLPQTGNLAFLGPPEIAATELAVQEINENGGVLGTDVVLLQGDSGDTSTDIANQTVDSHLAAGADAIVGAASSGVSFTVIDKIVGECVIQFSPANTSPDFTTYDDDDLYFRTAPSDVLQGRVLADLVVAEGNATLAILALQDPYGEGLLQYTKEGAEAQGLDVVFDTVYDPNAPNFDAEVDQVISADPDAFVLIGFDESAVILQRLFSQGFLQGDKNIYLVDGNVGNALGENFN